MLGAGWDHGERDASDHSRSDASADDLHPAVQQRIAALDAEITQLRTENRNVTQLRETLQNNQRTLEAEERRMRQHLEQERATFERERKEEWSKLKRERKVWETHHRAARDIPDRRERQEIEK